MDIEYLDDSRFDKKKNSSKKKFSINKETIKENRTGLLVSLCMGIGAAVLCIAVFYFWSSIFLHTDKVRPLSENDKIELEKFLCENYPKRTEILSPLPYNLASVNLDIGAESAIFIDASNGCILYEKNADEIIPPASMTKLFVMYIVYQEVAAGKVSLDDVVKLPESCWWINLPSDSSLMFIGQGHTVTLRELLKGLAIASGNDAAIAVAYHISGNVEKFVERMNYEAELLGLKNTHFVEPSGYSENNLTTAREFAAFAKVYIERYPESLVDYHSQKNIAYPLMKNLPSWEKEKGDSAAIFQYNTNPLLKVLEGCDGLKTGFIYESGYNLSLTAKRGNERFISVTMKGPGLGAVEGNKWRVHDGKTLFEWGFYNFADFEGISTEMESSSLNIFNAAVYGGKEKFLTLVPAWKKTLTVPKILGNSPQETVMNVKTEVFIEKELFGEIKMGTVLGKIQYKVNDTVLEEIPLVADRNIEKAGLFARIFGKLAMNKNKNR